jgi:hypothetical protein
LENNSRNQGPSQKTFIVTVQSTYSSQGKKKKGDAVADDDNDDNAVRTSVSQDRVTVTLCTKELFLSTQYTVYSSLHISENKSVGKGKDTDGQHVSLGRPAGSQPSQLDLIEGCRVSDEAEYFCTIIS